MIEAGALVLWHPGNPYEIFPEKTAFILADRLPIPGIMSMVEGDIGQMSFILDGAREKITVKLSEVRPAGVA